MLVCAFPPAWLPSCVSAARLQSDGFYYFAHLRSLWFDGDQDLTDDYRLLGMGDKAHSVRADGDRGSAVRMDDRSGHRPELRSSPLADRASQPRCCTRRGETRVADGTS